MILRRVRDSNVQPAHEMQYGAVRERSTVDAIVSLATVLLSEEKHAFVILFDIRKAFDRM